MASLYDSAAMAEGYARSRPAVHPRVIELVQQHLGLRRPLSRALDVGCGSGLSTAALAPVARQLVGIEPVAAMARLGPSVLSEGLFLAGSAEELPFSNAAFDLLAAAGSLNYVDLDRFYPEARRVLRPNGTLLVYDFSPGRSFRGSRALDDWFDEFERRYPFPFAPDITPESLKGQGWFDVSHHEDYVIGLAIDPQFYLDYVMTETSVADAVGRGTPIAEIRDWCARTLEPVFAGSPREVLFTGYFACLTPRA